MFLFAILVIAFFVRDHYAWIALEGAALEHETHPFNKFVFHELEVVFLNGSENLPNFCLQDLIHDWQDLPHDEVFVDEKEKETFCERLILQKFEAIIATCSLKNLSSRWPEELSLFEHIVVRINQLSSDVNVVFVVDA